MIQIPFPDSVKAVQGLEKYAFIPVSQCRTELADFESEQRHIVVLLLCTDVPG
jgi:hypothetical protein